MELTRAVPPDSEVPSDAPMYMPEGPSARYNCEFGEVRYLSAQRAGWQQVEATWHDKGA